jgi:DNA repair protein RecO (recombination protein O)
VKETDEGIVISRLNYSDTSLILQIYLQKAGMQKFIYKGGKKRSAALFPLSVVEATYYRRPESELINLTSVDALSVSAEIPFDPIRSVVAYFIADVLRSCLKQEQVDLSMFEFIKNKAGELNEKDDVSLLPLQFLAEFTYHLGIDPQVEDAAEIFDMEEGVFCDARGSHGLLVEQGPAVKELICLFRGEPVSSLNSASRKEMLRIMMKYYTCHIPRFDVSRTLDVLSETLH